MRRHVVNMPIDDMDPYYPSGDSEGFAIYLGGSDTGPDYDAPSLAGLLRHYRTFLRASRSRGNVHLFHYADMTRDLAGAMAAVASAIGVSHDSGLMADLVEAATFESMKSEPSRFAPAGGEGFWKSDAAFFDSASSRKWEGRLGEADLERYDAVMDAALPEDERRWLEEGSA